MAGLHTEIRLLNYIYAHNKMPSGFSTIHLFSTRTVCGTCKNCIDQVRTYFAPKNIGVKYYSLQSEKTIVLENLYDDEECRIIDIINNYEYLIMAIDTTPSQVATNALQAIPFGSIIGGPLKACIEAQAMAAQTSWQFIQEVGLNTDPNTGQKEAVNVSFQFMQNGHMVQLNVPLLTIVPIPYIAIHDIDINFKANISASSSSVSEQSSSSALDVGAEASIGAKWGPFHMDAKMKANYSSKKDSKATQESKYSVEYTMDVAVKAGQDSMPAGLAKVLELLGSALDVSDPEGTLEVSARKLVLSKDKEGKAIPVSLIATYKNGKGIFESEAIGLFTKSNDKLEPVDIKTANIEKNPQDDSVVYVFPEANNYIVKAGNKTIEIKIEDAGEA